MKEICVAVIGSTGGGTATLGHTDPPQLLKTIDRELQKLQGSVYCRGISRALFIALENGAKGFDHVNESVDQATLYQVQQSLPQQSSSSSSSSSSTSLDRHAWNCSVVKTGTVQQVNEYCQTLNQQLATAISKGEIHALICISMSVQVFAATLQAASAADIPVTGTGGTSLSLASSQFRIRLVGNAGGSVANTSATRAVSYAHALATDCKAVYQPWRVASSSSSSSSSSWSSSRIEKEQDSHGPSWTSILNACLPAFWGVALLKRAIRTFLPLLLSLPLVNQNEDLNKALEIVTMLDTILERHAIPTACAVVAATSNASLSNADISSLVMASVIASAIAWESVLCGLLAGYLVSAVQQKVLYWCICNNVPATMTNLVATGGIGATIAIALLPIAPILRIMSLFVRAIIRKTATLTVFSHSGFGAVLWGCLCCYGCKIGWYHSVFLPLILIEMECGDASFLGAIDELTLVLVCAGVCAGNLMSDKLYPKKELLSKADLALCQRAVRINLFYGDFVEACYPFLERDLFINVGCYIASGLSSYTLVALASDDELPKSLAYLPLPVSIWLAGSLWQPLLLASVVAIGIPFLCVIFSHTLERRRV